MDEVWSVKDVMGYYGDELYALTERMNSENGEDFTIEQVLSWFIKSCEERIVNIPGYCSYTDHMIVARERLKELGYNVIFRTGYRRVK